jgi:hypothetical protein
MSDSPSIFQIKFVTSQQAAFVSSFQKGSEVRESLSKEKKNRL